jgi:excinuclease ABC subunit A
LRVLERLVDAGNTVLVVEHNLEVIQAADWVIDMGPEAGAGGGKLVVEGPPEDLVVHARRWRQAQNHPAAAASGPTGDLLRSHTGEALAAFGPGIDAMQPKDRIPRGTRKPGTEVPGSP